MSLTVDSASALHGLTTVAAHPLPEAGLLHVIRDAVIAILIVAFLAGGFLGFIVGRGVGRRER